MGAGFLALLILAADPAGGSQAAAAAPPASPDALSARAAALARLVRPSDLVLDAAVQSDKAAFIAGFHSDPQAEQLLTIFPGIEEAIWTDIEPEFRRIEAEAEPELQGKFADLYARRFSLAELDALHRFYSTPTGTKMIRKMITGTDMSEVWKDAAKTDDFAVSGEAVSRAHQQAIAKVGGTLTAEDYKELFSLANAVSPSKLKSVGAELQALTIEYVNRDDPELERKVEALVGESAERYIKAHSPQEAK